MEGLDDNRTSAGRRFIAGYLLLLLAVFTVAHIACAFSAPHTRPVALTFGGIEDSTAIFTAYFETSPYCWILTGLVVLLLVGIAVGLFAARQKGLWLLGGFAAFAFLFEALPFVVLISGQAVLPYAPLAVRFMTGNLSGTAFQPWLYLVYYGWLAAGAVVYIHALCRVRAR